MTDLAQGFFEAKKHAYRQTQEGVVVSFVIHPNDLDSGFAIAPLGTRYMVAFAAVGDDGQPVAEEKPKGSFGQLPLSQQAAIRCNDPDFMEWLEVTNPEDAAVSVRDLCGVSSRSGIKPGTVAGGVWLRLEVEFQDWLTSKRYGAERHAL